MPLAPTLSLAAVFLAATPTLRGQTPPPQVPPADVRFYDAPRASGAIVVDGRLDDDAWQGVPWTEPFVDIRGAGAPSPRFRTRARMTWDETHFYVAAILEEPHLWATLTDRDAIIYRDHDFEVFLDPGGRGIGYFELEINARGTEFDLFLDRPYSDGGKADIPWNMTGLRSAVFLDGTLNDPTDTDRGWTLEIAIPWSALVPPATGSSNDIEPEEDGRPAAGRPPSPGDTWRVNFSRVQWPLVIDGGRYRKEREAVDWTDHPEDNWVWSAQGVVNMHVPGRWGVVRFVGPRIPESRP